MDSEPPPRRRPVVLVGFMGAGKTSVGRLLAERLGVPFADADEVLTARAGRTPREIFAQDGEDAFRALERAVVAELVGAAGTPPDAAGVVALGGGAVQNDATRAVLSAATVVYLEVAFDQVLARVGGDPGRPVLARPDLPQVYAARLARYREVADVTVRTDGRSPQEVAAVVHEAVASHVTPPPP